MSEDGRSEVARVTLTPQLAEMLDRLIATGIHGRNRADVIRRIIGALGMGSATAVV